jgi:hypothetical protein
MQETDELKALLSRIITSRQGDWTTSQIVDEVKKQGYNDDGLRERIERL